jgi:hypothetical protein
LWGATLSSPRNARSMACRIKAAGFDRRVDR